MNPLSLLSGLGKGFGLDNSSSTAQSTPFYNESGIYFNSPGAGKIEAGDAVASATPADANRQLSGGNSPQSYLPDFSSPLSGGSSALIWIAGGAVILIGILIYAFKK